MPKTAEQRMTPAQINAAFERNVPVAVHTGFKRGFSMDAAEANVVGVRIPRIVFRGSEDLIGRTVKDGVNIVYADGARGDCTTVAPSDILSTWAEYVDARDAITAARAEARAAMRAARDELEALADKLGGQVVVDPDAPAAWGIFVPRSTAIELGASMDR